MVEVPAQVVPAPALQSLAPFRATPKHFSLLLSASAGVAASADSKEAASTRSRERLALLMLDAPDWLGLSRPTSITRRMHGSYVEAGNFRVAATESAAGAFFLFPM